MLYTHIYHNNVNSYPQDGENVLHVDDNGNSVVLKVTHTSNIKTEQFKPNWIYLHCVATNIQLDEESLEYQNDVWENMHRVVSVAQSIKLGV